MHDVITKRIVVNDNGCWIWQLKPQTGGYGQITRDGKNWLAHRYAYTLYKGSIPNDLCLCHRCDTPLCVNPDHLFVGTHADNTRDAMSKSRVNLSALAAGSRKRRIRKVTDAMVYEIRASQESGRVLAKRLGLGVSTVSEIRNLKRKTLVPNQP